MDEFSLDDYLDYYSRNQHVIIGDMVIPLKNYPIKRIEPREDELGELYGTVWSFPKRGRWATHRSDYRGNWPPQIPRILIQMYTKPGDLVADPMIGSGTTCIEALLLSRKCIGADINKSSLILAWHRLYTLATHLNPDNPREPLKNIKLYHADARNLDGIKDNTVKLVATHPPYWKAIKYASGHEGDLSGEKSLKRYLRGIWEISREIYRILEPSGFYAILLGDSRRKKHYVPVSIYALLKILNHGFILKEEIVKIQHRMKDTKVYWERYERDFLMIKHEKLYVFRKPAYPKEERRYRYSSLRRGLQI